ncbi:tRNA(Glu)-specific nuclease WapA [compost metagenome]
MAFPSKVFPHPYAYDPDNRLRSVTQGTTVNTFSYDPESRLRRTVLAGVQTDLLYDGNNLAAEYNSANALLKRYVFGPGVDEPLLAYDGAATTSKNWLYADHQGSIIAQANTTGTSTATFSYGPYGEPNTAGTQRFRYTGQQYLPQVSLYYYKARFYSPALGRFLQTDPIGYQDDMNLYAYVGNNPFNRTDPTGQEAVQAIKLAGKLGAVAQTLGPQGVAFVGGMLVPNNSLAGPEIDQFHPDVYYDEAESGNSENWHEGSFDSSSDSLAKHFDKHGKEVGAKTEEQYLDKAQEFAKNLKGATKKSVPGATEGVVRYTKNGKYVDMAPDGRIVSFGKK